MPSDNAHPSPPMMRLGMDWYSDLEATSEQVKLIRTVDWASTDLGLPSEWPAQLHQAVDFLLADPAPAAIMWGEKLTMIYNEGFVEFAGTKHPALMGGSPVVHYAEVWSMFVDIIERGRQTGEATRHKDAQLFLNRHGYLEECFVTYTFVPLLATDKSVVAFYHTALETTSQVVGARRTRTLLAIGDAVASSRSIREYWQNLLKVLEDNTDDMHWTIAYSFINNINESFSESEPSAGSSTPRNCTLAGASINTIDKIPLGIDRRPENDHLLELIESAIDSGETMQLDATDESLPSWIFELGPVTKMGMQCKTVLLIPIRPTTKNGSGGYAVLGFLLVGLPSYLRFDEQFSQFIHLCSRQLGTSAASIMLLEQEIRRQEHLAKQLSSSTRQASDLKRKFTRFEEISNIGMWIASAQGELLYANKAWYQQAELPTDTKGMTVDKWVPLVTEESLQKFAHHWNLLMTEHQPVTFECQFKTRWRSKDPKTGEIMEGPRWFLISALPELAEDNITLKSAWGCNVDVSYQKWAESVKDHRVKEIMEAKRQTENFIDMVSHEMRNPLSAILQSADSITSTIEDAVSSNSTATRIYLNDPDVCSVSESAATITACAQHQKRIVDDILTLSKLDASLLVVTNDEVDPIATVQHALQLHQQDFKSAGVEGQVRVDMSYHELQVQRVFLDPSRLLQVLINLLTNAIKFTQFQPVRRVTVHLGASPECPSDGDGDAQWFAPRLSLKPQLMVPDTLTGNSVYLHFSVEDTGCGLSDEQMQRLFTRFTQASPKTHVQYGGSGLGLFICKELTELQGGRIGVTSTLGRGSTFKFYLKVKRAISVQDAADANAAKLEQVTLDAEAVGGEIAKAIKTLQSPNYAHKINRYDHSESSNPIVGSAAGVDVLHVLIVEDNLINQKVMATQLRKAKCVVHVADHGANALIFLKKSTFARDAGPNAIPLSIVLMDLEMPVMDGLTCIAKIREMQRTGELTRPVPTIAVTANARLEQVKKAKDYGMDDVVTKPFRIKDLLPRMYNLIEKVSV